jgi:hypothetical protein
VVAAMTPDLVVTFLRRHSARFEWCVLISLDPLLATVHLLAHQFCELNTGPIVPKKIAKLQGHYVEYEYKLSNIFTLLL